MATTGFGEILWSLRQQVKDVQHRAEVAQKRIEAIQYNTEKALEYTDPWQCQKKIANDQPIIYEALESTRFCLDSIRLCLDSFRESISLQNAAPKLVDLEGKLLMRWPTEPEPGFYYRINSIALGPVYILSDNPNQAAKGSAVTWGDLVGELVDFYQVVTFLGR